MQEQTSASKRLDIQGLRAIALLMVVLYHAGLPFPGGFTGVDVFFVISGFVITGKLHRECGATGRINFSQFYLQRFKRLIPALAMVVTLTCIASALILSPFGAQQITAKTGLGAMLLSANYVIADVTGAYFSAPAKDNPLLNIWSLSVEEQFYIAFPVILLFGWQLARRVKHAAFAPPFIIALMVALSGLLGLSHFIELPLAYSKWLQGFYSPVSRAWEFGAGSLLFFLLVNPASLNAVLANLLGVSGAVMVGLSLWLINDATPFPGVWTLLPVAGVTLIIAAGAGSKNFIGRCLSIRPLAWLGDLSYAAYLWHWPFIAFAAKLWPATPTALWIAALVSFLPAVLSFYFIEQPLRKMKTTGFKKITLFMLCISGPPLIAASLLLTAANAGFWMPQIRAYKEAITETHLGKQSGCFSEQGVKSKQPQDCVWNAAANGKPIYLVGDSHADQFSEAVLGAGKNLNRPVYSYTEAACPFIDAYLHTPLMTDHHATDLIMGSCHDYYTTTMAWLKRQPAGTVVIASIDQYWTYPGYFVGPHADALTSEPAQAMAYLQEGLHRSIAALEASGHQVIVVLTIPVFMYPHVWKLASCSTWSIINNVCYSDMPLSFVMERQQPAYDAMRRAVQGTNARLLNLNDRLCPNGTCGGDPSLLWTNDGYHILPATSRLLASDFEAALSKN